MTESKRRKVPGLRRKTVLGCALLFTVVSVGLANADNEGESDATRSSAAKEFDFATGNSALEVIYPVVGPSVREHINQVAMDGTLVLRVSSMMETAWYDAAAPYHRTAVGVYSDLGRRPAEEKNKENINTAMLYSTYRVMNSLIPQYTDRWREMLTSVGLDPDNDSTDRSTPTGLGNLAGNAVVEARENDGMNQLGNEGGRKYHRKPYADYTGYKPVNTAHELKNPSRWQPELVTNDNGIFEAQHFVTPQIGITEPMAFDDVKDFTVKPPKASNHHNRKAYKKQADEVIEASANLNDKRKISAEYFNDKLLFSSGFAGHVDDDLMKFVQQAATSHIAGFDSQVTAFHNKLKYDTVRPFSAIRWLYGDKEISAWGGPGKGTVHDMPGKEWESYLQTADHAEYPSGSTAFCAAQAQVFKRLTGTDKTHIEYRVEKGGSYIEPGVTPKKDTVLTWNSWDDLVDTCAKSRVWGGVHFPAATTASKKMGTQVGDAAYEFMQAHIKGERPEKR